MRDESEGDEAGKLAEGSGTRSHAIRSATGFYRFPLGLLQAREAEAAVRGDRRHPGRKK